ncbi:hypothetical protein H310_07886 [Aphanomyces invadans]|uniref:Uncharacterized protein n=1 Tax=Aphanomyces invadans TaxID=157072 RepID=A0A024U2K9_9STRA|nr:hypothetical protein H310_07886 [Aphanomyces invadans]ETV99847.1 hypothetical protein H310_07886 [Aphanomyces invadans]|eukprot:XP_008871623.1 hypothetical protein H310_07886 [Aphanomyces invadans]
MTRAPPSSTACTLVFDPAVGIFDSITAFMPGRAFRDWTDGYSILCAGHAAMLADKPCIELTASTMNQAAEDGRLDVVSWLVEHSVRYDLDSALYAAVSEGHLNVVQFFLRQLPQHHASKPDHDKALMYAASGGHLAIVQELVQATASVNTTSAIAYAADFGQGHVVEWLENRSATTDDHAGRSRPSPSSLSVFGNESVFVPAPVDTKSMSTHRRLARAVRQFLLRSVAF